MSDDDVAANLVARLRQYEGGMSQTTMCYNGTREEAAAAIERLTRERDENFLKWQNLRLSGAQDWQARAEAAGAELAKAREALADVCSPVGKLRRDADAQGARLSDSAYRIANSLSFVQGIARAALAPEGK